MAVGLLPGVRVLDLGQRISAPYCAEILARLGAEVIKVEPPEGDAARQMGPFPDDVPHPEKSGLFLALNANKYGVTLDLPSAEACGVLRKLATTADILIESFPTGFMEECGLGYDALRLSNPGLIMTSITSFGDRGPYASFKSTDLILFHMSGHAHALLGPVEEPDSQPPIRAGGHQAELLPGLAAATATLMALYRKRLTGVGCRVKIGSFEAMVNQLISGLANCAYGRPAPSRDLGELRKSTASDGAVGGVLPCADGYVAVSPREDAQWERWLHVMGDPKWAGDERFAGREARQANAPALWQLMSEWSRPLSKSDVTRRAQDQRIPCFPANTVADLLEDAHLASRDFFVTIDHPVAGAFRYPGTAYRFSNAELPLGARPAPLLGQHNETILSDLE